MLLIRKTSDYQDRTDLVYKLTITSSYGPKIVWWWECLNEENDCDLEIPWCLRILLPRAGSVAHSMPLVTTLYTTASRLSSFELNSIETCKFFDFLVKVWRFCKTAGETEKLDMTDLFLDKVKSVVYPLVQNWLEVFVRNFEFSIHISVFSGSSKSMKTRGKLVELSVGILSKSFLMGSNCSMVLCISSVYGVVRPSSTLYHSRC